MLSNSNTEPTSPSTDPTMPGTWQDSFQSTEKPLVRHKPKKEEMILSPFALGQMPCPKATEAVYSTGKQ